MKSENRNRGFMIGLVAGVVGMAVGGLLAGVGTSSGAGAGDTFVTSSPDGRHAYLWVADGGSLRFVSAAETKGSDGAAKRDDSEKGEHGKGKGDGEDDKPAPEDKEKGKDKGKGKK